MFLNSQKPGIIKLLTKIPGFKNTDRLEIYWIYIQLCLSQLTASLLPSCSVTKMQRIKPSSLCFLSNTSENFLLLPISSQQLRFSSTCRLLHNSSDFLTLFCLPQHAVSRSPTFCQLLLLPEKKHVSSLYREVSELIPLLKGG